MIMTNHFGTEFGITEKSQNVMTRGVNSTSSSSSTSSAGGSRRQNVGGYSRTFKERRYEIKRNFEREKHTNRQVESETRVTFHRNNNGEGGIYAGPTGAQILTIKNNTFSFPIGTNSSTEFSNVTFFHGEWHEGDDDNVHPLTRYTETLHTENNTDGQGGNAVL